jgi:hypothetical protein
MKVPVFRLRALDKELEEMLAEADGRCSTAFALRLDETREKIAAPMEAAARSEARIYRRHADQDGKGNPVLNEKNNLKFSTADQQEKLNDELSALVRSEVDIDDTIQRIKKSELVNNGLATSGTRIANLRPILDAAIDEPVSRDNRDESSIVMPQGGRIPRA